MKTNTLTDERQKAEQQAVDADEELAQLEQQRASLVVDARLGDRGAATQVKAVEEKIARLERDRYRARLAVEEIVRREKEQERREVEAQRERVVQQREKLLVDRGVVLDRIVKTGEAFADDVRVWLRLTAQIDALTTNPAMGGTPSRSRSRLQSWLFGILGRDGGAGLDEVPYIQARLRVRPDNQP